MTNTNFKMPEGIRFGTLALIVSDLHRSVEFYENSLGFQLHQRKDNQASLGLEGRQEILLLSENPKAGRPHRRTGLYHFAVLVPSRAELARTLVRLSGTSSSLEGASDHGVSEALYLSDPDGNGIEVYRDRPKAEWPMSGGELQMMTGRLNMDGLLRELQGEQTGTSRLDPETVIGHIHLQVASIPDSENFYVNILGFDLMQRYGDAASFVSAGGYHHHIGFNTWQSAGAPPPEEGSLGLEYFSLHLPSQEDLKELIQRLSELGHAPQPHSGGYLVRDPSGIGLLLAA